MVKLVDVVGLIHVRPVLRQMAHETGELAVDDVEHIDADAEIARSQQSAAKLGDTLLDLGATCSPAGRSADDGHTCRRSAPHIVGGGRGSRELYGSVGRSESLAVDIGIVIHINDRDNLMAAFTGDALDGVTHLPVTYKGNFHNDP